MSRNRNLFAPALLCTAAVAVAAAVMLNGCAGSGKSEPVPQARSAQGTFDPPMSPQEKARVAALVASAEAKISGPYGYRLTGRAAWITVSADGSSFVHLTGPGDWVRYALVPKSEAGTHLEATARRPRSFQEGCGEDCSSGGGSGTPTPPPPPPNFGSCSSRGGATWYDRVASQGGCLDAGSGPRQLSCGSWTYSGPGRGTFSPKFGGDPIPASWIADDGSGVCDLGG
jgi:hypothetical protein